MEIKGKVALVTGGAVRIGRAISLALAERGAKVAIHYNTSEKEARATGTNIFQADLNKTSEIEKLVDEVEKKLGPIQILINNASIFEKTPFLEVTESNWDRHMNINLKAPFLLSQRVARSMFSLKTGKIINITDAAIEKPYKNYSSYLVSKGGLMTLTKALALELAPYVQVNAIAPGRIPDQNFQEVANAAVFLIEADCATGSVVTLNGEKKHA
ncbi:MAG: hypothetical protein A2W61_00065 [Deltaproteobacteria bacterium RIFCSPLOWO2_01_44_7]|nr:MAG: hypothetical protein A2712_00895 [Deltaproteobacteria bacterium RIFCSPHIGHO2_01_FULL_43_49]OGQ15302.1 MAG: hypothetical protein A3D22_04580 [Deltaproteobacteria bacterium RIFCSPHIGHO2_02_FULL_44_53]OGQ27074.1 MAG: hypothetical protein A3D98_01485 [Deltaproteobacteria bacterium RIFCSPHIGHO2_12_FULL_44_21]OGQ31818.1 MAG: hypothetical protein A2979_05740 [Deltaproteobacteria bacterium RIFCSPLOWO2_01_FULL_45_74]OGQ37632.1 MAG: hypothetical protein A2W61_00065 [Deltaproteobacteria bacterium 